MSIYIIFYSAYNVHFDSLYCPGEKKMKFPTFLSVYNFPHCKLKEVGRGVSCFNAISMGKSFCCIDIELIYSTLHPYLKEISTVLFTIRFYGM